jgi:hypothetical protein
LQETADAIELWLEDNGSVAIKALQKDGPRYLVPGPPPIAAKLENRVPRAREMVVENEDEAMPDLVSIVPSSKTVRDSVPASSVQALSEADREDMLKVIWDKQKRF